MALANGAVALREDGPAPDDRSKTGEAEAETTSTLSKDVIFSLLQNSRRRSALRWLADRNGQGTTGELAEHIAAQENDISVRGLTSGQRKRVYIALYQCHLPKMDDCGVVTYDQSRGTVELTEAVDDLFPYLELAEEGSGDSADQG